MASPNFSQVDFISSGRTWQRAYFTTYALSLTFFESYLLPQLRRAGCERVIVFVDSNGYHASLMELKSQAVGREYSLIPIRPARGIFHPKITYLWGGDGDILLVGSGNLTFGGHGKNIEVLEALNPDDDAAAFVDFAEFLEQLVTTESLTIPDISDLTVLARRARDQVGDSVLGGATRLLHSLQTPILDQLIDLAAPHGPWTELLCLSPYHHPAGTPVRELAERLKIQTLKVGVPPSPSVTSAFPFEESRTWPLEIATVAPKVNRPKRPLHAKWFELRGKECWTLTGSVNATKQSLDSTRNVEVSVLRSLETRASENWKTAREPGHEPTDFPGFGQDQSLVLHAVLSTDGWIEGQVLGSEDLAGHWEICLQVGDKRGSSNSIEVRTDGRFRWCPPDFHEFAIENSAQITLTKGSQKARGWLSVLSFLNLPFRSRAAQAAIARMIARPEALDDCRVLLDYIAFHINKLFRSSRSKKAGRTTEAGEEPTDNTFLVADLSLDRRLDLTTLQRDLAEEAAGKNRSWKTLSLIARLLAGRNLRAKGGLAESGRREVVSEQEDEDTNSEFASMTQALDQFNNDLYQEFGKGKEENRNLVPFLVVWLNVNLDMQLRRLADPSGAFTFAGRWIRLATYAPIPEDIRSGLAECVYGVAAALAYQSRNLRGRKDEIFKDGLAPQSIHQWLESHVEGDVDPSLACKHAEAWFETATPNLLIDGQAEDAVGALAKELEKSTPRMHLEGILEAHSLGEAPTLPKKLFGNKELVLLKDLLRARADRPRHRVIAKDLRCCPKCYVALRKEIQTMLRTRRLAQCIQCTTILVLLKP